MPEKETKIKITTRKPRAKKVDPEITIPETPIVKGEHPELPLFGIGFIVLILVLLIAHIYPAPQVQVVAPAPANDFTGTWTREDSNNFDNTVITISDQTATGFTFSIDAQSGANSGEWSNYDTDAKKMVGTISFAPNTAHYTDDPTNVLYKNDDGTMNHACTGDFTLSATDTVLDLNTDCSDLYAGFGGDFSGTFRKDATVQQIQIKDSDLFVAQPDAYKQFATLVGNSLNLFNQTIAVEDNETVADKELGNVTYSSFAVPHAYTELESMVVVGPRNSIWAAVINYDTATNISNVRYFTTESKWKNKVPRIISDWMENFSDDPIIYESK